MLTHLDLIRFELIGIKIDISKSLEQIDPVNNNHTLFIYLLKSNIECCQNCGTVDSIKIIGSQKQTIKYSTKEISSLTIVLIRRTYKCSSWGTIFKEINPFCSRDSRISDKTIKCILEELKDLTNTFKKVAKKYKISITAVQKIFDKMIDC